MLCADLLCCRAVDIYMVSKSRLWLLAKRSRTVDWPCHFESHAGSNPLGLPQLVVVRGERWAFSLWRASAVERPEALQKLCGNGYTSQDAGCQTKMAGQHAPANSSHSASGRDRSSELASRGPQPRRREFWNRNMVCCWGGCYDLQATKREYQTYDKL